MKSKGFISILIFNVVANICCNNIGQQGRILHEKFEPIFSNEIPNGYLQIFKPSIKKDLVLINTLKIKYRSPIATFYYDKRYYLQTYLIDSDFNSSLKKLHFESVYDDGKADAYYSLIGLSNINYQYKLAMPEKISDIYLNLYGSTSQMIMKNDSIAFYTSNFNSLSIKYNRTEDNDIYCWGSVNQKDVPIEILFLRKNLSLYLLIMSPTDRERPFSVNTLYNLIN